ncbi:hypothetical protein ACFLTO_06460 [Chloroflexota bacterium]
MIRCPNCGQKTIGEHCQWCKYPIPKGRPASPKEAHKQAEREARLAAWKQTKRNIEKAWTASDYWQN